MNISINDLAQSIETTKAQLRERQPDYQANFDAIAQAVREDCDDIVRRQQRGEAVIPEVAFEDIAKVEADATLRADIHRRGCLIVRNTFTTEQANAWNREIVEYIEGNGYYDQEVDPDLDQYFSSLQSGKPQIFGLYWSKPQMMARQSEALARVRRHLNRLWQRDQDGQAVFDPERECSYADRVRRREPGDNTLGLKPHIDGGSVERWLDPGFQKVYGSVFNGQWRDYQAFSAAWRTSVKEIKSPAVCSVFRTFQGWTALSAQGPGDGTLQLIPSTLGMPYLLLRALQDDVPADSLCDAQPGRALSVLPEWHADLLLGLISIPQMQPGDSIWWHPDLVHAVEDQHQGEGYSNVIYIGSAPYCEKNAAFLPGQARAFLAGESSPDFAAENYELHYPNRATEADLSPLGKRQMGLLSWD